MFKKAISLFVLSITLGLPSFFTKNGSTVCFAEETSKSKISSEEKEDFNFIKSNGNVSDFIYDGSLLLYGGITLVAISIAGMTFTVLPRRKK